MLVKCFKILNLALSGYYAYNGCVNAAPAGKRHIIVREKE